MVKVIKLKSGSQLEEQASFSRVVSVGDLIFVSITAGRNPETQEIPDDVTEQAYQVFANIERALIGVGSCLADVVSYRIYIPNPEDIGAVAKVLGKKFRKIDPASVLTCTPLAAPYYKVEMEVTAYRDVSKADIVKVKL